MKKLGLAFICVTTMLLLNSAAAEGQSNTGELKGKRLTIHKRNETVANVFAYLIIDCDVPIGFEESTLDRNHNDFDFETNLPYERKRVAVSADGQTRISVTIQRVIEEKPRLTIDVENVPLAKVLDTIVAQMNNYKWEIHDGVVDIFPVFGRDKRFEELLSTNIETFVLTNPFHIFDIRTRLIHLPEVENFLKTNNIHMSDLRESIFNQERKLSTDLNFSGLNLRDLLNKITNLKRGGWILKKSDAFGTKDKEYFEIDI
jgi:hypothetical protein